MFGLFIRGTNSKVSHPQLMIMLIVKNDKKYGYEILRGLRELFDGVWEPKTGAIYPSIKKLQEDGFLVSEMISDKEHYGLSDDGRELLVRALPELGAMVTLSTRFATVVDAAIREMGCDMSPVKTFYAAEKEEQLRHLRDMRTYLESSLIKVDETIYKIERGLEWDI
ncbi:MAG: PadR family transcriptional regulator [Methanomassiliicoccaceae archaeon]|nr:PadR family transcriptional regulator [Methanomassiliicoccaceae archaeon]